MDVKEAKSVLFVCVENRVRSPAAERIFTEIASSKGYRIDTSSAGLDVNKVYYGSYYLRD